MFLGYGILNLTFCHFALPLVPHICPTRAVELPKLSERKIGEKGAAKHIFKFDDGIPLTAYKG